MVDASALESLKIKKLPPAWPKGLLTFMFFIFLLTLGIYFGLNFWNQNQMAKLSILEQEFQNIRNSFTTEEETKVVLFEKKLKELSNFLNNHIYFSSVLEMLEELTHSQLFFSKLDFSINKNFISLNGLAKNQEVLSEAISGFLNDTQRIKAVVLKEMQISDKNQVSFSFDIYLQPNALNYKLNERNK